MSLLIVIYVRIYDRSIVPSAKVTLESNPSLFSLTPRAEILSSSSELLRENNCSLDVQSNFREKNIIRFALVRLKFRACWIVFDCLSRQVETRCQMVESCLRRNHSESVWRKWHNETLLLLLLFLLLFFCFFTFFLTRTRAQLGDCVTLKFYSSPTPNS